ncbi:hypothetical protein QE152_g14040 [Popillia japonica]|uniref:Uncharacterized protein n=1 Tax=Popillia japonica TaxID=7064 RepID=A0AAW1L9V7_POPJA
MLCGKQMKFYLIYKLWDLVVKASGKGEAATTDRKRDARALSKIGLLVQPQCLVYLQNVKTTKAAREALAKAFEDKGISALMQQGSEMRLPNLTKLFRASFAHGRLHFVGVKAINEAEDVAKHIAKLEQMWLELQDETWKLMDLNTNKKARARNVIFLENNFSLKNIQDQTTNETIATLNWKNDEDENQMDTPTCESENTEENSESG